MIVFLASLPAEQHKTVEEQLVHGHRLGLEPQDVFRQIVLGEKKLLYAFEERAKNSNIYEMVVLWPFR